VEHSPISVAVLVENGGRSHQFNESVASDAEMLIRPLLNALDREDRLAVFAYDDAVHTIADFSTPRDQWNLALARVPKPKFSESNFYDATLTVLDRLTSVSGRKALLIFSSGIDTFSRTAFTDVLARAEQAKVPMYVFNLGELARRRVSPITGGLLARVDWARCAQQLERLAKASGGRAYLNAGSLDVSGIYDEIIEDTKVRYVLTYTPHLTTPARQRTVQVAVVDPSSREATQVSATARDHHTRVIAETTYTPADVPAPASTVAEVKQEEVTSK
jgi:VWFA-related protein